MGTIQKNPFPFGISGSLEGTDRIFIDSGSHWSSIKENCKTGKDVPAAKTLFMISRRDTPLPVTEFNVLKRNYSFNTPKAASNRALEINASYFALIRLLWACVTDT